MNPEHSSTETNSESKPIQPPSYNETRKLVTAIALRSIVILESIALGLGAMEITERILRQWEEPNMFLLVSLAGLVSGWSAYLTGHFFSKFADDQKYFDMLYERTCRLKITKETMVTSSILATQLGLMTYALSEPNLENILGTLLISGSLAGLGFSRDFFKKPSQTNSI